VKLKISETNFQRQVTKNKNDFITNTSITSCFSINFLFLFIYNSFIAVGNKFIVFYFAENLFLFRHSGKATLEIGLFLCFMWANELYFFLL
jgi:hypothetical protein